MFPCLLEKWLSFKIFTSIISYNICQEDYNVYSVLFVSGNPCRNGGIAVSSQFGYHCLCSRDYHGRFCDGMERAMSFLFENELPQHASTLDYLTWRDVGLLTFLKSHNTTWIKLVHCTITV